PSIYCVRKNASLVLSGTFGCRRGSMWKVLLFQDLAPDTDCNAASFRAIKRSESAEAEKRKYAFSSRFNYRRRHPAQRAAGNGSTSREIPSSGDSECSQPGWRGGWDSGPHREEEAVG